jgi:predicted metalloprotease with PDZ domain
MFEANNSISINWENIPSSWKAVNSFNAKGNKQLIKGIEGNKFVTGVFWAGENIRVHSFDINNKPCFFATTDKWAFEDSTIIALIKKTISFQRAFWNDYNVPNYLITLIPTKIENGWASNGRGLYNSFAAMASNNEFVNIAILRDLFNHELMHHWIGNQIVNAQPEALMYWFSEGFTSYFTEYNMFYSNQISRNEYIDRLNKIFKKHYGFEHNNAPNSQIQEGFFKDRILQELPYSRGLIYAFYLDCMIEKESKGKKT